MLFYLRQQSVLALCITCKYALSKHVQLWFLGAGFHGTLITIPHARAAVFKLGSKEIYQGFLSKKINDNRQASLKIVCLLMTGFFLQYGKITEAWS